MRGKDWETTAAYYAFVSHGIFPQDFLERAEAEKLLMFAMMEQEAKNRNRK